MLNVSDWAYVAIAYTIVWGSLAVYALLLARRVAQTRDVAQRLSDELKSGSQSVERDGAVCDTPPAP